MFNDSQVIVAVISGLCVAVPTLIATVLNSNNNRELTSYKLEQLGSRFDLLDEKLDKQIAENAEARKEIALLWAAVNNLRDHVGFRRYDREGDRDE